MKIAIITLSIIALIGLGLLAAHKTVRHGGASELALNSTEVDWAAVAQALDQCVPSSHFKTFKPGEFEQIGEDRFFFEPNSELRYFAQSEDGSYTLSVWTMPGKPGRVWAGVMVEQSYWMWEHPRRNVWDESNLGGDFDSALEVELEKQNVY